MRNWVAALAAWAAATTSAAADQVLLDFTGNFDFGGVVATDAKATRSESGPALRIWTGHQASWPGVTLRAPGGSWDLSAWAQVALKAPLRRADDDKLGGRLFGMRGYPVRAGGPGTVDARRITQLLVFVGCHWFQYNDEPVTGRVYDEENYQIGFVAVADSPYAETVRASRQVGRELYR